MKKNKKLLIGIGIVALLGIVSFGIYKNWQHESSDSGIRIGVLSFLTGTYAQMGQELVNGIILAKEEFRLTNNVDVVLCIEDGKAEAKSAASAMSRLFAKNITSAIIAGDNQVPTVAPMIVQRHIPSIATILSNSKFLESNKKGVWIFRNWISMSAQAHAISSFATAKLKLKRIAILKMQSEFGEESQKTFSKIASANGAEIVFDDSFIESGVDFKSVIAKMINSNPEAVYIPGYGSGYNILINQIKEMGYKGYIFTADAIMNPDAKAVVHNFDNIYFSRFNEPETPVYKTFLNKYEKRFNTEPSVYAAYGYDSFNILMSAIFKNGLDSKTIRDNIINNSPYQTLIGELKLESNGDCILPVSVYQMQDNGTAEIVQ